ncbi:TadE/TadG family type IV pilus assembly protein [Bacillus sp. FJAT-44742]|uniref:TadE/TadG family type IV pilus assembly protein n=1 Tax=Bacillus sp. FJAT-44742 TaxID=2014005 RepID=UPI000C23B692|nr:TadE/TadG family type IV pilus assembly protein [Bacillus sp. FJAT-44742]
MLNFFKKFRKSESGNALVLVTLSFGAIVAILGLVIDGGHLYTTKSHLQKTANAAALSGAQEIPNSGARVQRVVGEVLVSHEEGGSLLRSTVENNRQLHVELERDVPLFFASLFGRDSVSIHVEARASLNPMGEAKGAVPLGIDEKVELNYGEKYELKVDSGDSEAGSFGVLALAGSGANHYGETLKHGFKDTMKVGDIIPTQTGNIAGATREGINHRIDTCPYPNGEYRERDCPRVMLVVVYKPHEKSQNQLRSIQVTGFAYFYVTDRMGRNDDSIKGTFIKRTGPGMAGTGTTLPPDRGAYAIRLTE